MKSDRVVAQRCEVATAWSRALLMLGRLRDADCGAQPFETDVEAAPRQTKFSIKSKMIFYCSAIVVRFYPADGHDETDKRYPGAERETGAKSSAGGSFAVVALTAPRVSGEGDAPRCRAVALFGADRRRGVDRRPQHHRPHVAKGDGAICRFTFSRIYHAGRHFLPPSRLR